MDQLLKQAADEYLNALSDNLPEPEQCKHAFSKHFENQMRHLIAKAAPPVRTAVMRVVACLAVALFLFGSVIAIDTDAREAFLTWVEEQFGSYIHFFSNTKTQDFRNNEYTLGWIPDGYRFDGSYEDTDGTRTILYVNDEGKFFRFAYLLNPEQMDFYLFFSDQYDIKNVWINNYPGKLYLPYDESTGTELIWQSKDGTLFELSGICDEDMLVRAAENIQKK